MTLQNPNKEVGTRVSKDEDFYFSLLNKVHKQGLAKSHGAGELALPMFPSLSHTNDHWQPGSWVSALLAYVPRTLRDSSRSQASAPHSLCNVRKYIP